MTIEKSTWCLVDDLIAGWNKWPEYETYYLKVLAPQIVHSKDLGFLPENERCIATELQKRLSQEDWEHLPDIIVRRRQTVERQKQEKKEKPRLLEDLTNALNDRFERAFLAADSLYEESGQDLISRDNYDLLKARFVKAWAKENLGERLDIDQAAAVAAYSGNVLVSARAGSGKTKTLVSRAIFLQKHCGTSSRQILLLAFNRAAAKEMKKRLANVLGDDLPHVMTFHALAHALVKPQEQLLFNNADSDQIALSREVESVIEDHIESEEFNGPIKSLMLAHFREGWERVAYRRLLSASEVVAYRRGLPHTTLAGHTAESSLEKIIANTLFEHDIEYEYKKDPPWGSRNYRPQFTLGKV